MAIPVKPTLAFLKSVLEKGSDLFNNYSIADLEKLSKEYITRFAGGNKKQAAEQLGYKVDNKNNLFLQKLIKKGADLKSLGGGKSIKFTKTQLDEALPKEIENYNKTELKDYIKKKLSPKSSERNVNDINAYKALDKYIVEHAGGNQNKAFQELSKYDSFLTRTNVSKSLARKRGYNFKATGKSMESTIDAPVKYKTFSEATIAARDGKFNVNERVKELIDQGKIQNKKYYNSKDMAIIFNMEPTKLNTDEINRYFSQPYRLYKGGVKGGVQPKVKKGANPQYNELELNSTVENFNIHAKTRQAPPDSETSTFLKRRKTIADIDKNFTKYINNYKGARTRTLSNFPELNKVINQNAEGVMFDIGHSVPVEILDKFDFMRSPANLKKFHSIKDFTIQDPRINRDILVGSDLYKKGTSIAKKSGGFQAKEGQLINELNLFLKNNSGKIVDENSLKFIDEWNKKAKQLYQDKFNAVNQFVTKNVQKEPYLKGQQFTTTGFQFNAKPGQKINGDMLDIDKTFFKTDKTLGEIGSINPNANTWDDLSTDEKLRINENIADQTLGYITVAANKANIPGKVKAFDSDDIQEFGETLFYGDPTTGGKGLLGKTMNTVLGIGGGTAAYKGTEIIGENLLGTELQASERKPGESPNSDIPFIGTNKDVEYGDPDTWGMKVGQFIEQNPYTSGALGTGAAATTKLGRKAIGQILKTGLPIRYGPTGVAYDLATADYSDPMSRLYLEGELAIAPATVKGTSKAAAQASRIFGANPVVRRFLERAVNLGARAPTALRFARVASPIGLASLGLEGLYYTYKKAKETQDAIAAMSEEEKQNYLSEQELQALMGEAEFATGGRVGFETGGPGDKKKTTPLLDKPTIGIDPFELNKPVDLAKRDTLKGAGILGAGIAAGKLGLLKLFKSAKAAKAAKVAPLTKIIPPLGKTMTQFPKWFPTLISKVRKEGKQIPIYKEVEVTLTKPEYDKLSKEGAKVYDRYLGRTDWYKEKLKKEGVPRYYTNKKTNEIIGYEYEVKDLPDVKVTEYGGEELTVSFPNAYGKNVTMEYTPPKGTKDATFKVDDAVPEWGASPDDAPDFYAETVNSLDEVYGGASRIEQKVLKLKKPRTTQGDEVVARAEAQYDYIKDTAGDLDEF